MSDPACPGFFEDFQRYLTTEVIFKKKSLRDSHKIDAIGFCFLLVRDCKKSAWWQLFLQISSSLIQLF